MGSAFRLPHVRGGDPEATLKRLRAQGLRIVATVADGGAPYASAKLDGPSGARLRQRGPGLAGRVAPARGRTSHDPPASAGREPERRGRRRHPALRGRSPAARGATMSRGGAEGTGDLFGPPPEPERDDRVRADAPLAERVRPRTLDEILGQDEAIGPGKPLRRALEADAVRSLILWGPPGTGKTTLAQVVRRMTRAHFESMSAVLSGVKELREILKEAEVRRRREGPAHRGLHRRDPPLQQGPAGRASRPRGIGGHRPHRGDHREPVVRGELGPAVAVAGRGAEAARRGAPARGAGSGARGRGARPRERGVTVDDEAISFLARAADGDARTALNVLEIAVTTAVADAEGRKRVDALAMQQAFARKALLYDRAGEEHFNIISALHKSVRNSDADAGLYWLARMLEAGEDPLYVARRLVRFASEDVGPRGPPGPRPGHGRAAGRPLHRDARRSPGPGRARRLPGRGAEEQRGVPGLRRGHEGRPRNAAPSPCPCGSGTRPPAS